jgi:hypothetical protein
VVFGFAAEKSLFTAVRLVGALVDEVQLGSLPESGEVDDDVRALGRGGQHLRALEGRGEEPPKNSGFQIGETSLFGM